MRANQADFLIELAQAAELFHTADGTGFADLDVNGHRQTLAIRGKGFRRWLARRFFQETGGAPGPEALQSALNVIEPKAHFDGPERVVHDRPLRGDRRVVDDAPTGRVDLHRQPFLVAKIEIEPPVQPADADMPY